MNPAFCTRSRINMADRNLQDILREANANISNPQQAEELRNLLATTVQQLDQYAQYQFTPRRDNAGPQQSDPNLAPGFVPPAAPGLPNLDDLYLREPSMTWDYGAGHNPTHGLHNISNQAQASSTPARASFFDRLSNARRPNQSLNDPALNQSDFDCLDRVYASHIQPNPVHESPLLDLPIPLTASPIFPPASHGHFAGMNPPGAAAPAAAPAPGPGYAPSGAYAQNPYYAPSGAYPQTPYDYMPQFRTRELPIAKFFGAAEEYREWKSLFRAQVDFYPPAYQVSMLREHVDSDSREFLAYIDSSEVGAYEQCFVALDQRFSSGLSSEHLYMAKIGKLLAGPKARNLSDLENIFNVINFVFAKVQATGQSGNLNFFLLGVSNILFGRSKSGVEKLMMTGNLNTPDVLKAIWDHMSLLRIQEQTARCAPASALGINLSSTPSYLTSPPPGALTSPPSVPPQPLEFPGSIPDAAVHQTIGNRSRSPGRTLGQPPTPNFTSPNRSGQLSSGSNRNSSPFRSRSYKCQFCLKDDHSHLTCNLFTPQQQFNLCKERRLCFICKGHGHTAAQCSMEELLKCSECPARCPPHSPTFCELLRPT